MASHRNHLKIAAAISLWPLFAIASFSQAIPHAQPKPPPVSFEVNRGQSPSAADVVVRTDAYTVSIRAGQYNVHPNRLAASDTSAAALAQPNRDAEIRLAGSNDRPEFQPEEMLPGYGNFLFGSDPQKWITGVPHYAKIQYAGVYPGIDVLYHTNQDRLETDFIVHPRSDPSQIVLEFSNTHQPRLNKLGDLRLDFGEDEFTLQKPHAYQRIGGRDILVEAAYAIQNGRVHFRLGPYASDTALVIDPVLVYSTFLGVGFGPAGNFQVATSVAVDSPGNLYVLGATDSTSFPVTSGVLSTTPASGFLSKFDPTGTLIFSTYFTGFTATSSRLVVDSSGNIYIGGPAVAGLPIPSGSHPFQSATEFLGILKLNSTGSAVLAGTYLGGSGGVGPTPDQFGAIAIDSNNNVYVTGSTSSLDFPTQNPLQAVLGSSGANAFVTKFDPTLSTLVYSTYLGQASSVGSAAITVDTSGNAYVVGGAGPNFPTTSGAFQTTAPLGGAFLAKINPAGSSLLYATYVTGSSVSGTGLTGAVLPGTANAVVVDASGNIFLAGQNLSPDFPDLNPIQPCTSNPPPSSTVFVSKFNAAGALVFSTCLGNDPNPQDQQTSVSGLALDPSGKVFVLGATQGTLTFMAPIDSSATGFGRNFVSEIDPAFHTLIFSSYIGGTSTLCCDGTGDHATGMAVDSQDNIYVVGTTTPLDSAGPVDLFPIFNARQPLFGIINCIGMNECGYFDAFVLKISPSAGAAAAVFPSEGDFVVPPQGFANPPGEVTITVADLGTDPLSVSSIAVTQGFSQTNNCSTVAPSGGSCSIMVTLAAGSSGPTAGLLTITDNSAGSPHTVPLVAPGASASPTGFALIPVAPSASVSAGSSASFSIAVAAGASFSGTLQLTCTGAPVAATCAASPSSLALGAGQLTNFSVSVSTTARSGSPFLPSVPTPWLYVLVFVAFGTLLKLATPSRSLRWRLRFAPLIALLVSACGNGSGSSQPPSNSAGTPAGTYTIVVTAKSGATTQSQKLALTVK